MITERELKILDIMQAALNKLPDLCEACWENDEIKASQLYDDIDAIVNAIDEDFFK